MTDVERAVAQMVITQSRRELALMIVDSESHPDTRNHLFSTQDLMRAYVQLDRAREYLEQKEVITVERFRHKGKKMKRGGRHY